MNITSSNKKNVVSLQQLVPQHDCLKLLILHTPYTLIIDSLDRCINLVKLDLSKNNIQTFPYIGDLRNLKVMFIHQNKLDVNSLKTIFEKNNKKSHLSQNIVWVTYWGNKNSFLGRHYLVNETSAIAIDKNLIVQQQKVGISTKYFKFQSFSPETDISSYFAKKNIINRYSSEEEYMRQLWSQLRQLRERHQTLFPIIKIQKLFRGWIVRHQNRQDKESLIVSNSVKKSFFINWKQYVMKRKKLKNILQHSRKEFLLLEHREMIKKQIYYKMIEIARQVKRKIYYRKLSLKSQMRFYGIVVQNYLVLKNVYKQLGLEHSSSIYIYKDSWEDFEKYIIPFTSAFLFQSIKPMKNRKYCLNNLYQYSTKMTKQMIKLLKTNTKSLITEVKDNPIGKKSLKGTIFPWKMKSVYKSNHISTKKRFQVKQKMQNLQKKRQMQFQELIRIQGSFLLLKTITRGIYFYNTKRLNLQEIKNQRIFMLSQFKIKEITSAVKIQKNWRGYIFRKKNYQKLKTIIKIQRAAIIIQRWARNIRNYQKSCFVYRVSKKLDQIHQNSFCIQFDEYLKFLEEQKTGQIKSIIFEEQDIILCLKQNKLSLCWNINSFNPVVQINIKYHKLPFTNRFLTSKLQLNRDEISNRILFEKEVIQPCFIAYLFHYQTKTNLILKNKKKYLEITCQSRKQVKFRQWILNLLTYTIKNKQRIPLLQSKFFKYNDLNKKTIDALEGHFICNENFELIKLCQTKFLNNINMILYAISNKCYFHISEQKPIKNEEKFFIYFNNIKEQKQEIQISKNKEKHEVQSENKRYKTQFSEGFENFGEKQFLMTEHYERSTVYNNFSRQKILMNTKTRSLVKKKSVKRYKIEKKKNKFKKNQYPNFVLDSFSMNQRLATQPDRIPSQNSLYENNLNQFNSIKQDLKDRESKNKLQDKIEIDIKKRPSYVQKKTHYYKNKEEDFFLKKFINLGNFIQNQYASEHRRRIKTQIQMSALESAENVKRELLKSQSQRMEQQQLKLKKIRENHNKHRQLVQKSKALTKDLSYKLKNDIIIQKQKKMREKTKIKRLKVSFAEQCFPLALKSNKNQCFP